MSKRFDPETDNSNAVRASRNTPVRVWLDENGVQLAATVPDNPSRMPQRAGYQYLLHVLDNGGEIAVATENGVVSGEFQRGESVGVLFVTIDEVGEGWAFERTYTRFHDWMHLNRAVRESDATKPPGKGWKFIGALQHKSIVWYRLRTWDVYQ